MRKMYKVIISMIMTSILMSPVVAVDNSSIKNQSTYRILIDQHYGFFRTYEMYDKLLGNEIFQENNTLNISKGDKLFENHTLNISKGDTIIFSSDTIPDVWLTVISEENLWNADNGILKYGGKEFSYTFNKSGIFNMYLKEHPLLKQRVIVGPIDINETIETGTNITESNLTSDTKLSYTNITEAQNSTNTTGSNLTMISSQNNTTATKQNLNTNKSGSAPIISISLENGLFSKIKSKSDTSILAIVLFGIYLLSGRIKDD